MEEKIKTLSWNRMLENFLHNSLAKEGLITYATVFPYVDVSIIEHWKLQLVGVRNLYEIWLHLRYIWLLHSLRSENASPKPFQTVCTLYTLDFLCESVCLKNVFEQTIISKLFRNVVDLSLAISIKFNLLRQTLATRLNATYGLLNQ